MPFAERCTTDGTRTIRLNPTSKSGKPVKIQPGSAVWSSTEGDPGTLVPAADGMSCKVVSPDALDADDMLDDVCHVTCIADGDVGDGVEKIEDSGTITFVNPNASSLGLSVEPEVPK